MLTRRILFASTAAASLAISSMAAAQTAPADETAEDSQGIQDIVVTAQRVESSAQKTPISLTVYSGEDLADQGITDIKSLAAADPSVNFTSNNGTPYVAIRGIASTDTTEIGDPSVPFSRDGFFTNRPYALQLGMYDVARVEVLKGPQGTLNGRNSTGGLINVITNRPSRDTGAYGSVEVGNYGTFNGELGVNAGISDAVQVRVSGVLRHHEGYRFLTGTNIEANNEEAHSIRAQILVEPFDGFHAWVAYQNDYIDDNGPGYFKSALRTRPDFGKAKRYPGYAPIYNSIRGDRVVWEVGYDKLPFDASLTYAGGYEKLEYHNAAEATNPAFAYPATRVFKQNQFPETWNHEIRIATPADNTISFQGGYFNFKEDNKVVDAGIFNVACVGAFAPGGANAALCRAGQYAIRFNFDVTTRSEAVFGQFGVRLGDKLKLSVGGRQTWDEKSRVGTAVTNLAALASPFIGAPPTTVNQAPSLKDDQFIYHIGLDFTPSDDSLFYAKYDTGYKAGGFNVTNAGTTFYAPEKVKTFEVGTKNRLSGNTLQLNASAFYTEYSNYQANQIADGFLQVFNTGGAKIWGVEGSFRALFGQGGTFDLNAAYLDTKFDNGITIVDGSSAANGVARNIGGNNLPNAPKFVMSAAVSQDFDIGSGKITARLDGKYSSKFYYTVFNDFDTSSRSYAVGNASLTYAPNNGIWEVQAFVRNITNEVILARAVRNYNAGTNDYEFQAPRTFGLRGSFKF
ncbi:TonB-dependent receptor [Sphingopyxis sp. H050]|uniref:TonB-dependent receptor n=1 Tax=Sphingopyxis sp. H050 TaxID=1759072 RepID=UPI000735F7FF|nr:TonB-dependent receptor [Sphingopyxis sp. H050]